MSSLSAQSLFDLYIGDNATAIEALRPWVLKDATDRFLALGRIDAAYDTAEVQRDVEKVRSWLENRAFISVSPLPASLCQSL